MKKQTKQEKILNWFDYLTLTIVLLAPLIFWPVKYVTNQVILTLLSFIYAGFCFWFIFVGLKIYYLLLLKNKK